jgi:hypothetical protein
VTVGELLEHLRLLLERNPGDITKDTEIILNVGVLKGAVRKKLKDDAGFYLPVVSFVANATEVGIEPDDNTCAVMIQGGAELETAPVE